MRSETSMVLWVSVANNRLEREPVINGDRLTMNGDKFCAEIKMVK
jgi:hypothetical protein